MVRALGCAGWTGWYGCLGLDGSGWIMRGMWILALVESGRGAGLSGLEAIPKREKKEMASDVSGSVQRQRATGHPGSVLWTQTIMV